MQEQLIHCEPLFHRKTCYFTLTLEKKLRRLAYLTVHLDTENAEQLNTENHSRHLAWASYPK